MREGVARRFYLIREMQLKEEEEEEGEGEGEGEKESETGLRTYHVGGSKSKGLAAPREESMKAALLGSAAGEITAAAIDFFAKEKVRQSEMERVSSLAMAAAAERRSREAVERARREEEEEAALRLEAEEGAVEAARVEEAFDLVSTAILKAMTERANEGASEATGISKESAAKVVCLRDAASRRLGAELGLSEDLDEEVIQGSRSSTVLLASPSEGEVAHALSLMADSLLLGEVQQELLFSADGGGSLELYGSPSAAAAAAAGDLDLSTSTVASLSGSQSALPSHLLVGLESESPALGGGTDVAAALEGLDRPVTSNGSRTRGGHSSARENSSSSSSNEKSTGALDLDAAAIGTDALTEGGGG